MLRSDIAEYKYLQEFSQNSFKGVINFARSRKINANVNSFAQKILQQNFQGQQEDGSARFVSMIYRKELKMLIGDDDKLFLLNSASGGWRREGSLVRPRAKVENATKKNVEWSTTTKMKKDSVIRSR